MSKFYKCFRCGKIFTQKSHYNVHINRKISCAPNCTECAPDCTETIQKETIICKYCGANFTRKFSLSRHISERCKEKQKYDEEILKKIDDMEQKIKLLEEQCKKNNGTKIINNTQNIMVNQFSNTVPYGSEDLEKITNAEYEKILRRGRSCVPEFVKKIHFNYNFPYYHNIKLLNIRGPYIFIYDGNDWKLKNCTETVEEIFNDKSGYLEMKFDEMKNQLDSKTIKIFQNFLNAKDSDNGLIKKLQNEIKIILYEDWKEINKNSICDSDKLHQEKIK